MFLFSWKKIFNEANGSIGNAYIILDMLINNRVPRNKYDSIYLYYEKDFKGLNFLVNSQLLMQNAFKYSRKEVVQYVALASFRRYADYLANKTITLDLIESPIGQDSIKQNRLLRLENGIIHFLFEEVI